MKLKTLLISLLSFAFLYCSGTGDLQFDLPADSAPNDVNNDIPRGEDEYLYHPGIDRADDIPHSIENFSFRTVLSTELNFRLRLYDNSGEISGSGESVLLLHDSAGRLLWAGQTINGNVSGRVAVLAHTGTVRLTIYKKRFGQRIIELPDFATIKTVDRQFWLEKNYSLVVNSQHLGSRTSDDGGAKLQPSSFADLNLFDADSDNIPDIYDDFPSDPERAFRIKTPADGFFTIAFEDRYPVVGDADYNDFTARYALNLVLDSQNRLVEITGVADAVARLAGYNHRFGLVLRFPGAAASLDLHRAGADCATITSESTIMTDMANIVLFEHTANAFTNGTGHHSFFTVHFNEPIDPQTIDPAPYDPYIFVHNTGKDIHLIGQPALPGSNNSDQPQGFRDPDGFPWALLVPINWQTPKEARHIEQAYPLFSSWRSSLGIENSDWYFSPQVQHVIPTPDVHTCKITLQVDNSLPEDQQANVPVDSVIRIFFNQSIDPLSVGYDTLKIQGDADQLTGRYSVTANEITFLPFFPMNQGVSYSVSISKEIQSVTKDKLLNDHIIHFSTETAVAAQEIRQLNFLPDTLGRLFTAQSSGTIFFAGLAEGQGYELWRSDGGYHDTLPVRDIWSGVNSSSPSSPVEFANRLFFSAEKTPFGRELYISDGTLVNTQQFADIFPGASSSNPDLLTVAGDSPVLFFTANDGLHGRELWVLQNDQPRMVFDINSVDLSGGKTDSSDPAELTPFENGLLFSAEDGVHGRELWFANAVTSHLVGDLQPGNASSRPRYLTKVADKLFFTAQTVQTGTELFCGNTDNISLCADIFPGTASGEPRHLTAVEDNKLFFTAHSPYGRELWLYRDNHAQMVYDLTPGAASTSFGDFLALEHILLFVVKRSDSLGSWEELWRSDGTEIGTILVRKLTPGNFSNFTRVGSEAYFTANDGLHGQELWKTNSTFSGTLLVRDVMPGLNSSYPDHLILVGNSIYFRIYDPFENFPQALWRLNLPESN